MTTTVLTVEELSFSFGGHRVLQNLSFTVPHRGITSVAGANGCGKSTLFRLLCRELRPASGTLSLYGNDLRGINRRDFAKQVAVLHQNPTAPPELRVRDLVAFGREPHRTAFQSASTRDHAAVADAISMTGLNELAETALGQLSGGQRQRAFLALALAQEPELLLLDEPTSFLDLRYQNDLLELILLCRKERGITVLMILHDINQILAVSDHMVALSPEGTLLAAGDPGTILTEPLLEELYGLPLRMAELHGQPFVLPTGVQNRRNLEQLASLCPPEPNAPRHVCVRKKRSVC